MGWQRILFGTPACPLFLSHFSLAKNDRNNCLAPQSSDALHFSRHTSTLPACRRLQGNALATQHASSYLVLAGRFAVL